VTRTAPHARQVRLLSVLCALGRLCSLTFCFPVFHSFLGDADLFVCLLFIVHCCVCVCGAAWMHRNERSVLEFYGLAGTTSVFQDVRFQVAPKAVAQLSSDLTDEAAQADLEAAICLPKKPDQAGFDLATVETVTTVASKGKAAAGADPDDVQTKLLLCHQCKWSLRDKPKSGLPQMLNTKYKKWKKQMAKWPSINGTTHHAYSILCWISARHIWAFCPRSNLILAPQLSRWSKGCPQAPDCSCVPDTK